MSAVEDLSRRRGGRDARRAMRARQSRWRRRQSAPAWWGDSTSH